MARISTYALDAAINDADKLIGTDADNSNQTKNFSLEGIAEYVIDKLIDPDANQALIPVFRNIENTDGANATRITGSIMYQDTYPTGTQIGITGNLLVEQNATVWINLSVAGESYLLGNVYLGTTPSDFIKQRGTLELLAPIKDSSGTLGNNEQVLVSDAAGIMHWENYQGTGLEFQSSWNPETNTPDLTAIPLTGDNTGKYWVAGNAGDTDLGGITNWFPGDWAIISQDDNDNIFWSKIDNSGLDGVGITNYLPKWTSSETLGVSSFYQTPDTAPGTAGAISLNTTSADTNYGEVPGLRVASRVSNTPGVIDLFRTDFSVTAGDSVGILQYSVLDDGHYAVAQIGVETLTTSGSGDSGGGKFIFKTTRGAQTGAIPESRFELDNGSADFSVPINVTDINITGDVQIDTLTNNYIPVNNVQGVLRDSGFYQVPLSPITSAANAIGLNTTKLNSIYGEYPDLRVASRQLNDPGVLDLFRPDGDVQAGDRVGILQYSLDDDNQYTVAQIEVETLAQPGTGNPGGGKFCFKTSTNQAGAVPTERLCIDNTEADFSVPINVTNANQSNFAGNISSLGTIEAETLQINTGPSTITGELDKDSSKIINLADPTEDQDAATKAYVDSQNFGQITGNGKVYSGAMWDGTMLGAPTQDLISSPLTFRITDTGVQQPHSLAFGGNTTATGARNSVALGYLNTSSAEASLATGHGTTASGLHSASFNFSTTASGEKSAAFGDNTEATGKNSFAIGYFTNAHTSLAFAGGKSSTANPSLNGTTAFAYGTSVNATGPDSAAFGNSTEASGENSFVAGNSSTASGKNAHAIGIGCIASGERSIAIGQGSSAPAYGSIAIGATNSTSTNDTDSIVIGSNLISDTAEQVVLGRNNAVTNAKFVLGNGLSAANRKNGLEVTPTHVVIPDYGSGSITGAAAWNLAVDANGKIIETVARAYSSTVLLFSQSGTNAPVVDNVLENSLGISAPFNWTRVSSGEYNLNAPGKFKLLKTIVFVNGGSAENNHDVAWEVIDTDNLRIRTHNSDGKLTKASLEIKTYN